jgi:hypothetical protein
MTSKKSIAEKQEILFNPLELVEDIILDQGWPYQRLSAYEVLSEVQGRWGSYRLLFLWQVEINVLHITGVMDIPLNFTYINEIYELLALINERLVLGHFEMYAEEGLPAFRYSFLIPNPKVLQSEILEEMIDIAVEECERFFPAFQFVMSGDKKAKEAATVAIMDTAGEA